MKVEYRFVRESKDEACKDQRWYMWGDPMQDKYPGNLGKMLQAVFGREFPATALEPKKKSFVSSFAVTFSDGSVSEFRRVDEAT